MVRPVMLPAPPPPRDSKLLILVWAGVSLVAAVAFLVWRFHRLDIPGLSPGPGIALNQTNFPAGPRLLRERTFRLHGRLMGVSAFARNKGAAIFVFGNDRV